MKLKVGQKVNDPKRPSRLVCSHFVFPHAVVLQVYPLILTSESGDMIWFSQVAEGLVPVGRASLLEMINGWRRLPWKACMISVFNYVVRR